MRRGFTIIELLVVLAIVAIMGALVVGAVGGRAHRPHVVVTGGP